MQVFKFGGASVKDAAGVRNMASILKDSEGPLVVVVSAMGKTTNALEALLDAALRGTHHARLDELKAYHEQIAAELIGQWPGNTPAIGQLFAELSAILKLLPTANLPYGQAYDSVVCYGELISTAIVSAYLQQEGIACTWLDARKVVRTGAQWQEGLVNWEITQQQVLQQLPPLLAKGMVLTQGFIGATSDGLTTTLGREGSDFTAAILASCLRATQVTIWKDVPGVLNADPKRMKEAVLFSQLPYSEAAEMTYYGASVIHPKTIKPLANKQIPLFVRSFLSPQEPGTVIGAFDKVAQMPPAFIFKPSQSLLRFEAKDLSNINQRTLASIIDTLSDLHVHINLMMNTAVSVSVCVNTQQHKISAVFEALQEHFHVSVQHNLEIVTILNPTDDAIGQLYKRADALITLRTDRSFQFVREA